MSGMSRRQFNAVAAGFAVGAFAVARPEARAQEDAPAGEIQPLGFASTRIRTVESEEQREIVTGEVLNGFVRDVMALDGYRGYVLADVIDPPEASLSILVLEDEAGQQGFEDLAATFVADIEDEVTTVETVEWSGELLIAASAREHGRGTPPQKAGAGPLTQGYVVVRVHTSAPGTDPREVAPLVAADFVPLVAAIDGFRGYLWYPTTEGFVSIALFDAEEAAEQSSEIKTDWISEHLPDHVEGEGEAFKASIRFASLPVLA